MTVDILLLRMDLAAGHHPIKYKTSWHRVVPTVRYRMGFLSLAYIG